MVLPTNRLIVGGVDISEKFGWFMGDGYSFTPPEPKTYTVDIPGGDGQLDLTDSLLGDTSYKNRTFTCTLYLFKPNNWYNDYTKLINFLHGRAYDFTITPDSAHRYHGRFKITSQTLTHYTEGDLGCVEVSVDTEPYRYKQDITLSLDGIGGKVYELECGRKPVVPTFKSHGYAKIVFNSTTYELGAGTYQFPDIRFTEGTNILYLNTYPVQILQWTDLKDSGITWRQFSTATLAEWGLSRGDAMPVSKIWSTLETVKWSQLTSSTWGDQEIINDDTSMVKPVTISYEWGEL